MKSLRIDRDRAIRTGALAALIMLTVTFLPDLLRRPEPPPVPSDVGFGPAGTGPAYARPGDLPAIASAGRKTRTKHGTTPDDARRRDRRHDAKTGRRPGRSRDRSGRPKDSPRKGHRAGSAPAPQPAAIPAAAPPPAPQPVAPVSPVPPAPDRPPPPRLPADGSQEFSPR